MKAKDMQTLDALRMLYASLKNKAIEMRHELEDADTLAVIKSDLKKIEDSLESFVAGGREDLAQKARNEISLLRAYLPEQMNDAQLEAAVKKVIDNLEEGSVGNIGKAIGAVMADVKGLADGKRVREMIEKIIKGD